MKITDLHMHVIPEVDDGSLDIRMSLAMLELAYEQGVRDIFCTSHNVYSEDEIAKYKSQFMMLQMTKSDLKGTHCFQDTFFYCSANTHDLSCCFHLRGQ